MEGRIRSARPPEVAWLAALLAAGALLLVLAVLFPMSDGAPVELGAVGAVVAAAMAAGTWRFGHRLPRRALLGQAVFAAMANSALVAEAHTRAGAIGDAFAYAWLALYVAVFFPRAAAWYCGLVAAGYAAGLLLADLPGMAVVWAVVSVSVAALGALTARVTDTLRHQSRTDPLTGVANRLGLRHAAEDLTLRSRWDDDSVTVATWDLDDFKDVNDRHGHLEGDRLLVEAAAAWRGVLRRGDVLARAGGDEFVLLMPATSQDEAERILERLEQAHPVTWSAGLAEWRPGESFDECVARADARLYAAKAARRG